MLNGSFDLPTWVCVALTLKFGCAVVTKAVSLVTCLVLR